MPIEGGGVILIGMVAERLASVTPVRVAAGGLVGGEALNAS